MNPDPVAQASSLRVIAGPCIPAGPGSWRTSWTLSGAAAPLDLLEAWLPHDHFQGPRQRFDPPLAFDPGSRLELQRTVACQDPPGSVIENAFLILRVRSGQRHWRVFTRLTIRVAVDGVPQQTCEAVTFQKVDGT